MLKLEHITARVFTHWRDVFPLSVRTVYPGMRVDAVDLDEWVELWVDAWRKPVRRGIASDELDVSITVHCFSRHATDKGAVQRLVDAVRGTLGGAFIVVRDFLESGEPVVGWLMVLEPEARELTRVHAEELRGALHHVVVTFEGRAGEAGEAE
jgi:hypothetical protein